MSFTLWQVSVIYTWILLFLLLPIIWGHGLHGCRYNERIVFNWFHTITKSGVHGTRHIWSTNSIAVHSKTATRHLWKRWQLHVCLFLTFVLRSWLHCRVTKFNDIQYRPKGLQHYKRVKHVSYTHITRSVHAPYTQMHQNACNFKGNISWFTVLKLTQP